MPPSIRTRKETPPTDAEDRKEPVRRFIWTVASINAHLEDIHQIWANFLGVSEPQWLILLAIDELDDGSGVSGTSISAKVRIHPTFVTTQTKSLEKAGFLSRFTSSTDARFVLMSLTDKAHAELAKLAAQRDALNNSIFAGLDGLALQEVTDRLATIEKNAERAARRLSLGD